MLFHGFPVHAPVSVKVLVASIAHTNGILPVSRDDIIVSRARPAHQATTPSTVMPSIELISKKQTTDSELSEYKTLSRYVQSVDTLPKSFWGVRLRRKRISALCAFMFGCSFVRPHGDLLATYCHWIVLLSNNANQNKTLATN